MANCVLFRSKKGFDISTLPFGLNQMPNRSTTTFSKWNAPQRPSMKGQSTLHAYATRAFLAYLGIPGFVEDYALLQVSDNLWSAEFRDNSTGTTVKTLLFTYKTVFQTNAPSVGKLGAAVTMPSGQWAGTPSIGSESDDIDLSGAMLAMTPQVLSLYYEAPELAVVDDNSELKTVRDEILALCAKYPADWGAHMLEASTAFNYLYIFSDMFYYGCETGKVPLNVQNGNMDTLTRQKVNNGAFNGTIIVGTPTIIGGTMAANSTSSSTKGMTVKAAKLRYAAWADAHPWTPDEELLIPTFDDDFKVQPEVIEMADKIVATSNMRVPFRNFLWRGITGYGKSTGTKVLACILHTPRLELTCHTDMLAKDLISEFVPCNPVDAARGELPTFDEISFDPESAWTTMTGEEGTGITSEECFAKYSELLVARAGCTSPVKVVESAFVKAVSRGYICEIQEISRIKDSGVMVALNQYDLPGAMIPLVDGGFTYRQKDAVVVFTDNVGYASCRPIDQSVIRRCRMIFDSTEIEKQAMLERIKYNTGWNRDDKTLNALYDVFEQIRSYCADKEITEGSCTICELESLVCCVQCDDRYMAHLEDYINTCLIAKCTNDPVEQNEIRSNAAQVISKVA